MDQGDYCMPVSVCESRFLVELGGYVAPINGRGINHHEFSWWCSWANKKTANSSAVSIKLQTACSLQMIGYRISILALMLLLHVISFVSSSW